MLTPQVPKDILDVIKDLQRRIRELETGAPIRNASISGGAGLRVKDGGGITIESGGTLRVEDVDGSEILFIGRLNVPGPGGSIQNGVIVNRATGELAFGVFDPDAVADGYRQYWSLYDLAANVVASDDVTSGQGLARPYLAGALYPARFGELPPTTQDAPTLRRPWAPTASVCRCSIWNTCQVPLHRSDPHVARSGRRDPAF